MPAPRRGVADITIDFWTLAGLAHNPGLIPGWGHVIADVARDIAFDTEQPLRWRFDILERGRLLKQITTNKRPRTPTAAIRAFVDTRDGTCRFPTCTKPAHRCQADHLKPHAQGGPPSEDNLGDACDHHHTLRHAHELVHGLTLDDVHFWITTDGRRFFAPPGGLPIPLGDAEDLDNVVQHFPINQYIPHTREAANADAPWTPLTGRTWDPPPPDLYDDMPPLDDQDARSAAQPRPVAA